MRIENYSFGSITVDGKTYRKDVIILPERIIHPWWRKEGHLLQWEDLSEVLKRKPKVLIIGKGYSGVMRVPEDIIKRLEEKGITVYTGTTRAMVELYNETEEPNKAGAFHLTC